jgi:hypothetical protein
MKVASTRLLFCLLVAGLLCSCGSPGVPQPPELELAQPVRDLRAVRKGNEVRLTWTVPTETTDHRTFRHFGQTQVCRSIRTAVSGCSAIAELPTKEVAATKSEPKPSQQPAHASYIDRLTSDLETQSPLANIIYAVNVLNSYGRSAGLSNQVQIPAGPVLPAPQDLRAEVVPTGIRLSWQPVAPTLNIPELTYRYRVYRRDTATHHDELAGEIPVGNDTQPELLDSGFEWEQTYEYRVTVVTIVQEPDAQQAARTEQVEGNDTQAIRVFAHDIFPPAKPVGVQAVFSGPGQKPFIDLIWTGNTEKDLAGYNIYRHQSGSGEVKVNTELVKSPAFRDSEVSAGHEYFYSVTAVDVRGNESPKSEETHETVSEE